MMYQLQPEDPPPAATEDKHETPPEMTEEDDAILDAIWDNEAE